MSVKLFAYGTLKTGCCNHALMEGARFICKANTSEHYTMLDLDMFPGVLKERGDSSIEGELYEVDTNTLEALDIFEGKWFSREIVDLEYGERAWMYFVDRKLAELLNKYHVINDGNWKEPQR